MINKENQVKEISILGYVTNLKFKFLLILIHL